MLALVIVTALVAKVGRAMLPFVLATIPLIASILIVNALFYPGATDVILDLGPLALTGTGLTAALQGALRVIAFALSVAVFSLTTPTDDLLSDLERRGFPRRGLFIIGSAIATIPTDDRAGGRDHRVAAGARARHPGLAMAPGSRHRAAGRPDDLQFAVGGRGAIDGARGAGILGARSTDGPARTTRQRASSVSCAGRSSRARSSCSSTSVLGIIRLP